MRKNIYYVKVNEHVVIDLNAAKEFVEELLKMAGDSAFATIIDATNVSGSISARALFFLRTNKKLASRRRGGCFLANDPKLRHAGRFMERYYFQHMCTRTFANKEEAADYLETEIRFKRPEPVLSSAS